MNKITQLIAVAIVFTAIYGTVKQAVAQQPGIKNPGARSDFSNQILTNPLYKEKLDSIINNAPYVFEGRLIKKSTNTRSYLSCLFEINKVYKGEEVLQAGRIVKMFIKGVPNGVQDYPYFFGNWHIIFAKNMDTSSYLKAKRSDGFFEFIKDNEANSLVELELFCFDELAISFIGETGYVRLGGHPEFELIPEPDPPYYYSGLLTFKTKEEVWNFLSNYKLFSENINLKE